MQASDPNPNGALDREAVRSLQAELEAHFPLPVEETELVLMDVSPHRLHAYWHIPAWEMRSIATKLAAGEAKLVLRFHDQSEQNQAESFDIEITGAAGSRYVELWEDAKSYDAELGLAGEDERFIDLARSNTVELPTAQASTRSGSEVLTLSPLADALYLEPLSAQENDNRRRELAKSWQTDKDQRNDPTLQTGIKELFPLFPDPLAPVFDPQRVELHLPSAETHPASAATIVGRSETTPPPETTDAARPIPSPAPELSDDRFREYPLSSVADAHALAEDEFIPHTTPLDSLQAMASHIPAGFAFAPEANKSKAVLRPVRTADFDQAESDKTKTHSHPVSSFALVEGSAEDLNIELHIEGHAKPNSSFVWHGQIIPTRADGSFSIDEKLSTDTRDVITRLLAIDRSRED